MGLNDQSKSVTHANVRPPEGKSQVNTGLLVHPGHNSVQSIRVNLQQRDVKYFHHLDGAIIEVFDGRRVPSPACLRLKLYGEHGQRTPHRSEVFYCLG